MTSQLFGSFYCEPSAKSRLHNPPRPESRARAERALERDWERESGLAGGLLFASFDV